MITQLRYALIYHIKIHSAGFFFLVLWLKHTKRVINTFNVLMILICITFLFLVYWLVFLETDLATLATTLEVTSEIRCDVLVK